VANIGALNTGGYQAMAYNTGPAKKRAGQYPDVISGDEGSGTAGQVEKTINRREI